MIQIEKPDQTPLVVLFSEMQALLGGASPSTVRRLIVDGKLPPPVAIGHARMWGGSGLWTGLVMRPISAFALILLLGCGRLLLLRINK